MWIDPSPLGPNVHFPPKKSKQFVRKNKDVIVVRHNEAEG
jgi:hypothetical protein